jgi:hypothetical protein
VTIFEHWHPSVKPDFGGDSKTFQGAGKHPLGSYTAGTSSVEVKGEGCVAYAYQSEDCSGEKSGAGVSSTTRAGGLDIAAGIVSSSDELLKYWGCNDCVRCVQVEQAGAPETADQNAEAGDADPPTTPQTPAPTGCSQGHYQSGSTCAPCTSCSANAEVKSACTPAQDTVCQCVRGYVGSLGKSCQACTGQDFKTKQTNPPASSAQTARLASMTLKRGEARTQGVRTAYASFLRHPRTRRLILAAVQKMDSMIKHAV